ncbi:type II toxin-antitoxin system RelE/ParE family toxin [Acidisoma silvae]|uniref:Type II toxin-antitoxin system RelE/ParE family toxin n=1 Tax=Acidisoma silvae TaxID=2802396 RepID=A0A964DXJ8_9PROT|nr:type II toxin-antitoxin system RelE/ParE family toxin [Acidisoma silvae]MCB8874127.1 type II toxin-antitoxin system RelE/ParE family toxin [Acidisoma silvae]
MLPIRWREEALEELERLIFEIAQSNPRSAAHLRDRIVSVVLPLSKHPYLYRTGRVPGTRELVAHPNYIVVYKIQPHHIEIISVIHARRRYP